jgi:hypothetical protein
MWHNRRTDWSLYLDRRMTLLQLDLIRSILAHKGDMTGVREAQYFAGEVGLLFHVEELDDVMKDACDSGAVLPEFVGRTPAP